MTLSMLPLHDGRARPDDCHGWAVVQIRPDGSLGPTALVDAAEATAPVDVVRLARAHPSPARAPGPTVLGLRVGLEEASAGRLVGAARILRQSARGAAARADRLACLAHQALVEAELGDLHDAESHARQALLRGATGAAAGASHLALARVHLERAQHEPCARSLELAEAPASGSPAPWPAAARLVVEARLLAATGRPEAATRLLARVLDELDHERRDGRGEGVDPDAWDAAALRTARADLLLAAGEPRRALAVLTPLPRATAVEASVLSAASRLALDDHRGAAAVLAGVAEPLESAPLGVQLRAWVLEARLAHDRGRPDRARRLVGRALHAATAEDLRAPLLRDLAWVRTHVERDPDLRSAHLATLSTWAGAAAGSVPSAGTPGTPFAPLPAGDLVATAATALTARESEVLQLLAQMCSTEEIAAALYVSSNTVKTHLKGIFGKLCVNRRVDAVRRGRSLGLC